MLNVGQRKMLSATLLLAVFALAAFLFQNPLRALVVNTVAPLQAYVQPEYDLKNIGSVTVEGFPDRFVAKLHFATNADPTIPMDIYTDKNFSEHFLAKVEEGVPAGDLKVQSLEDGCYLNFDKIIPLVGIKYETHLADLWSLLKRQPHGGAGTLLTGLMAPAEYNLFFVRDTGGLLWVVSAMFTAQHSWRIGADPMKNVQNFNCGKFAFFSR